MNQYRSIILMILLLMLFSGGSMASDSQIILVQADVINLDQAIERVKKNNKGKILDAQTQELDGKPVHVIKVLTKSGHVKKVRIKAIPKE